MVKVGTSGYRLGRRLKASRKDRLDYITYLQTFPKTPGNGGDTPDEPVTFIGAAVGGGAAFGNVDGSFRGHAVGGGVAEGNIFLLIDPDFADVSLLLHFDGANNDITTVDQSGSPKTMARGLNAVLSTTQAEYGATSATFFDNAGNYWDASPSTDLVFSNSDPFTVEASIFITRTGTFALMGVWGTSVPNCAWYFFARNSGELTYTYYDTGGGNQTVAGTWVPTLNTWHKVAVDYDGTDIRLYADGVMVAKGARVNTMATPSTNPLRMGTIFGNAGYSLPGFLDEVRVTKGVARYASDAGYTPETAAFPNA